MPQRRTDDDRRDLQAAVRILAAERGGTFRRSDLEDWGIDPTVVVSMRRNGLWRRLHHGVYIDTDVWESAVDPRVRHDLRASAALASLTRDAHLYAVSAAIDYGLPVDRALLDAVHLVRPRGTDSRALRRRVTAKEHLDGVRLHVLDIPPEWLTAGPRPSVSPALAAWSTATLGSADWAVATMDGYAWQNPGAVDELTAIAERWPRASGAGTAREAISLVRTGAQTPLESLSRIRLMRRGISEPRLQVPLYDDGGLVGYVDMLFERHGVVGEADGRIKYLKGDDLLEEKRREDRLRALGYAVVRWGWPEAMGDMRTVASQIVAAGRWSRRRLAS